MRWWARREDAPLPTLRQLDLAVFDGDAAAGLLDRLARQRHVGDLFDRRLLFRLDVAVFDRVVDRPLRSLGIEALVDRPDAVLGEHADGVFDRLLRLLGRIDDRRD